VADVQLEDSSSLLTAFAKNKFGRNIIEDTSKIAADHNAVLAIFGTNESACPSSRPSCLRKPRCSRSASGRSAGLCIEAAANPVLQKFNLYGQRLKIPLP